MDLVLNQKIALVAGSSRGIGFAIAQAFLREGASVVITGRNRGGLNEASVQLKSSFSPERVLLIQADMTQPEEITRAFDEAVSTFGGVDCVVANVGSGNAARGWDLTIEDWESSLKTNLLGSMVLASSALRHLVKRAAGSLIFISSITGNEAINAPVPYSAAKAALLSAMKNLSRAVGPHGVRVNAVSPGNILFPGGSWERKLSERREFFEKYIFDEVPLQRFGRPEEVADAVVFLASERAAFINGCCLVIDGGQTRSF